jgi:hypothetical protein
LKPGDVLAKHSLSEVDAGYAHLITYRNQTETAEDLDVSRDTVNTPFMADIRERVTNHDAESLEETEKWSRAWQRKTNAPEGRRDPYNEEGVEDRDSPL